MFCKKRLETIEKRLEELESRLKRSAYFYSPIGERPISEVFGRLFNYLGLSLGYIEPRSSDYKIEPIIDHKQKGGK